MTTIDPGLGGVRRMFRVLIDPGHAPGNVNQGPTGYFEYEGMWSLSNSLRKELAEYGIRADLTRTEAANPTLTRRGQVARGYDMFISQHSNAHNGRVRGSEVFYSIHQPENLADAAALSAETARLMGNPNRGAKTKRSARGNWDHFTVIRKAVAAGCPRVFLIESGFHDNPVDEAWLKQDANLKRLAEMQARLLHRVLNPP